MEKRSTLKLIADLLGISRMTVSRALREGTSVDPELRAKVRETAREFGYQPDTRISQVMSAIRKSQAPHYRETLAFVWTHGAQKGGSSLFNEEFEGARHRVQQLGYKLDEFRMTEESLNGGSLSRILQSRGIRGALIAPSGVERAHPHIRLDWKRFCCVLLGQSFANAGLARVQHDHYFGCVLALRRLKRLNYKRIGLIMSHSMDERSGRVLRSAFQSFHPMSFVEAEKLIYTSDAYDPKALKKWVTREKPEVIVANFEEGFPQAKQVALNAPATTGLAALNWSTDRPEIAGIDQHRAVIGQQAADLLLLRLQGNQFGLDPLAPSIKVPGSWVDGASLRRVRHGRKT